MATNNNNKILNVPNLRFPEFSDEWELRATTDYFEFKNGLNPEAKRFGLGTKFISVMDILNNRYITYDKVIASVQPKEDDLNEFGVNYGDILFQRSSETLEDVGRANVYLDDRTALFGGFVIRGKKIGNYNPLFFRYLLSSPNARKSIIVKGAGAQHFNISQDGLSKVLLKVPSIYEQEKISQFINYIDERIETQSKIIEDLKKLKVAITNWLIKSIPDCSEIKYLEKIADIYQPQTIPTSALNDEADYFVYGANGIIGKYNKYNHELSQICITCRGNTCGNINFSVPKSWITGNAMVVNTDEYTHIVNKRYLYHYLSTINFTPLISGSGQPQIVRQPLAKLKIPIPKLEHQNKIIEVVDTFEYRIEIENKYLQSLLSQKDYLLSNMFI